MYAFPCAWCVVAFFYLLHTEPSNYFFWYYVGDGTWINSQWLGSSLVYASLCMVLQCNVCIAVAPHRA